MNTTEEKFCKKCGYVLITKTHKTVTPQLLKKKYIFLQWDYCSGCNTIWFDEIYKMTPEEYFSMKKMEEEIEEQDNLFKYL